MTTTLDKISERIQSPNSALALLPESKEIARKIPSPLLFQLEQAGEIATEILDERVRAWAEGGWTQRRIAEEIDCAPSSVSDRLKRLGVKTKDPRGGARDFARSPSKTETWTDEDTKRLLRVPGVHEGLPTDLVEDGANVARPGMLRCATSFDSCLLSLPTTGCGFLPHE
jgi:hypothetical protein